MSNNFTNLRTHKFQKGEKILVDTNVWMLTHGPIAMTMARTQIYSNSLRDMRTYNCNIYVDGLVISEFVNAFARYEYNILPSKSRPAKFKDFRNSSAFLPIAQEISINVNKILKISRRCESNFSSVDISSIISDFSSGHYDFNDLLLEDLCKTQGMKLLTDDADFSGKGIDILTANNKVKFT